jgi:sialate O-acetylesterase
MKLGKLICLFTVWWLGWVSWASCEGAQWPLVSPMFGDNMVLQRGKPIRIWGWARPGELIRIDMAGHSASAVTQTEGRWQVELEPPASGGPYTLVISAPDQVVTLKEILIGDVWLCGGQSNMELGLARVQNGAEEIRSADHPEIRLFRVGSHVAYAPAATPQGSWKICSPQTAGENGGCSATAYFFARKLQETVPVPIGLVVDCLGGSPAESWMNPGTLRTLKDFDGPLDEIARLHARGGTEYGSFLMHWLDEFDRGQTQRWSAPTNQDAPWQTVRIPGGFSELGLADAPGVGWFRKEFTVSDPPPAGKAVLHLGVVDKMDTAYVNGQWVGASSWVENPRAYSIANGVLKPGKNVLVVRVFKNHSNGGFLSPAGDLNLTMGDGTQIPLAGEWQGALSVDARAPHSLPLTCENYPTMPTVLFEGMILPVAPLSIRGVIWYQGEANFTRAHQYQALLPALITDWREAFQQGDLPFYLVGLPRFMGHREQPGTDGWAELREAQALTARTVKRVTLAVTVDSGEADNIHPKDKQLVGERLALCALAGEYGQFIASVGPEYSGMTHIPGALRLRFKHADGGLVAKGDTVGEFSLAGKDHLWHWAHAKIEGDSVVVASPEVPEPLAARYAWQANPQATLYNGAGLPAEPFRTDDWPGATDHAQPW